jgi:hypothetical protein
MRETGSESDAGKRSVSCGPAFGREICAWDGDGDSGFGSASASGSALSESDNSAAVHDAEVAALAAELRASRARLVARVARVQNVLRGRGRALL